MKGNGTKAGGIRFAVCALELAAAGGAVQLLPAGEFTARDGRPGKGKTWKIDEATATRVIEAAAGRATPFVIDYEHQTLNAEKNGLPAPAAGWWTRMEWRPGKGLYALDVAWTEAARTMIGAGEYRYLSPVFSFAADGTVLELHMAALTNYPAIDGMDQLAAAKFSTAREGIEEDEGMKKLLELLGLAEDAGEDKAVEALTALKAKAEKVGETETKLQASQDEVAALKVELGKKGDGDGGGSPDPAKYVPVETVTALQADVAALRTTLNEKEVADLVAAALADGRILPPMEKWARDLGAKDVAALKGYIEHAQPIAALSGTQTGGKGPGTGDGQGIGDEALAVCKQMGIAPEDYKKTLGAAGA